jgi:hypothetical protein
MRTSLPALVLASSIVPEPSGLALLALAVPALFRRRHQSRQRQSIGRACCEMLEGRRLLSFTPAVNYAVGTNPRSVVTADFNGDGKLDLATANAAGGNVSVRMGNGAGGFGAVSQFATRATPLSLAVGDFDNDGKLDLATLSFDLEFAHVSMLRGRGDGTFQPPIDTVIWEEPLAMAAADFNADGRSDLVYSFTDLMNWEHTVVAVLLSDGQGGFTLPVDRINELNGTNPVGLAVGDVNADGRVDVVTANDQAGTVSVLLGNGDGTLSYDWHSPRDFAAGLSPRAVAVGDFTGDGKADLVVAGQSVNMLAGRGDGTFDTTISHPVSGGPHTAVGTADFNADGRRDAIVTDQSAGTVSVLLGNGNGTLQAARTFACGSSPMALAVADFNADARPDVAAANSGSNNVSVLLNDGVWATKTFVGPGGAGSGGNWSNASNWSPAGAPGPADAVSIGAGKSVSIGGSATVAALTLADGATLSVGANGGRALRTSSLTISATSKLNLNDNDLIIDYNGASPINDIVSKLIAGRATTPTGIYSAQANASDGLYTLGVAGAREVLGLTGSETGVFSGQTVDATTVLVKFTYGGDANLDGIISGDDYSSIDFYVGTSAFGYANGDFNFDGIISGDDYSTIDFNYAAQGLPL